MASHRLAPAMARPSLSILKSRLAAALTVTLLVGPLLLMLPNASSSDPVPGTGVDLTRTLTWNFQDPANFTTTNAEVGGGYGTLQWDTFSLADDSEEDYSGGITRNNIDISSVPGSFIVNVSEPPIYSHSLQPALEGMDTYIREDAPNTNYGTSTVICLDGEVGKQQRLLIWFDLSSISSSAALVNATLWLYLRSGRDPAVTYSAYALTQSWVETEANWEFFEGGKKWLTAGGDFNPFPISTGTIAYVVGWHGIDLSRLVDLWLDDHLQRFGVILVPEDTGSDSVKNFVSSDDSTRPTQRPRLELNYTLPGEMGVYESAALGPGSDALFTTASWANGLHSALTEEFEDAGLSSRWSWTNDPSRGPGHWDVNETLPGWLYVEGEGNRFLSDTDVGANYLHEDVTGPFETRTHLSTNFTTSTMGAGLLILDDDYNWFAVTLMGTGSSAVLAVFATEAGLTSQVADVPWENQNSVHFRVHFNGSTALVYYGSDGAEWTGLISHDFQLPLMTRLQLGMCVFSGGTASSPVAAFEYLRVEPLFATTLLEVKARLGNSTVPGDPSWKPWSSGLTSPSAIDSAAKYIQYQVTIVTYVDWYSPSFDGFLCGYQMYAPAGVIETDDQTVSFLRRWLTITCSEQLNGGTVRYSYSTDHGSTWTELVTGVSNSISDTEPYMKLRIELETTNTSVTPMVDSIVAQYSVVTSSFYLSVPSSVTAGEEFSMTVEAKDENNVTITHWSGQVALTAMNETGSDATGTALVEPVAWISSGGSVVLMNQAYTVAETITIMAYAEGAYGLSAPITVLPGPADHVNITPTLDEVPEYSDIEFRATAHDVYCNPVTGSGFVWSADATLGTLNTTEGEVVTLQTGAGRQEGYLTVTMGEASTSLFLQVVPPMYPPEITGAIEEQVRQEDSGTWSLSISGIVSDYEDSLEDMRWYVTNEWLVTVSGENRTGNMVVNLTTKQDLFGSNVLHLVVVDSDGMTGSTNFVVTITPVNDAPSIDHISPLVVTYDVEYDFDFRYHVWDVDDPVDELTLFVDRASAAYATVKWLVIGFLYPSSLIGTQQFVTVRVFDGQYSVSTTVLVTVSSDKVPYSRALPPLSMDQGESIVGVLDLDDYFDDLDDSVLFFSASSDNVDVTIQSNHTVDVAAPIDWWGVEDVIFTAADDEGARCEEVMTVTVRHVNQPPSIEGVPDLVVRYDLRFDFDLAPYIDDVDNAIDTLSISANNSHIAVIGVTISLLFPRSLDGQTFEVVLSVSDGELSDSCSISVTVSSNYPPVPLDLEDHAFLEDGEVPYPIGKSLEAFFMDPEGHDDEMVFFAFTSTEDVDASAEENDEGHWYVWFNTTQDWNGVCMLTLRAVDPVGGLAERTVELEVIPQPDPPQLTPFEPFSMEAGSQRMLDLAQFTYDPDSDDEKFVFSASCEANQYLEVQGSVLILSFTEDFLSSGVNSRVVDIEILVLDGDGFTAEETLTVTVTRPAGSAVHEQQWVYVAMILTGGLALGLFIMAFGMRRRPFVIRDMMLIHNDGFLISRYATPKEGEIDEHILSSMLTAVLNFVDDSMAAGQNALKTFGFRDYHVIVERGGRVFAAIAYEGDLPEGIDETMDGFLATVERIYKKKLQRWSGDIETDFAGVDMLIRSFVKDHSRRRKVQTETVWKTRATDRTVRPRHVMIPTSDPEQTQDEEERKARFTRKLKGSGKRSGGNLPSERVGKR